MGNPRIIYTSRFDATLEGVLDALASVYALVLQEYQKEQQQATKHEPTLDDSDDHKGIVDEQRRAA